jgi:hypothetical protein
MADLRGSLRTLFYIWRHGGHIRDTCAASCTVGFHIIFFSVVTCLLPQCSIKVECLFMCRPMYSERMAPLQTFAALIPFGDAWRK